MIELLRNYYATIASLPVTPLTPTPIPLLRNSREKFGNFFLPKCGRLQILGLQTPGQANLLRTLGPYSNHMLFVRSALAWESGSMARNRD